jgi:uncharacterized repeat protein (TIGR02543 family)
LNVIVNIPTYNLTVTKTTGGSVKSSDGGINCGTTCTKSYAQGTSVTLTAYPDSANWKFVGWTGGTCSGTSTTCTFTMSGAKTVNAIFAPRPFIYQEF